MPPRRTSFTFPDRFKDGADASVDVAAPKTKRGQYLNQSFLSVLAMTNVADPSQVAATPYPESPPSRRKAASRAIHASTPDLGRADPSAPRPHIPRTRKQDSQLEVVTENMSASQVITPQRDLTESIVLGAASAAPSAAPSDTTGTSDGAGDTSTIADEPADNDSLEFAQQKRKAVADLPQKLSEIFEFDNVEPVEAGKS